MTFIAYFKHFKLGEKFYLEHIYLGILLIFILSYNFHFLWLTYDLFALLLTIVFLNDLYVHKMKLIGIISFFLLIQFSYSLYANGYHLISFLTFWDTLKHIPIMYVFLNLWSSMEEDRKNNFINLLWKLLFPLYCIDFIWIGIESSWTLQPLNMDNMAGLFGDGGTHSIAYFSILILAISLWSKKNILFVFSILFSSIYLNYLSENIGFYPLLFFILFVNNPMLLLPTLVYMIVLGFINDSFQHFMIFNALERILSFINMNNTPIVSAEIIQTGRQQLQHYASDIGGWFGQGLGAFSSIYGQNGFRATELLNDQLPISSLSHLIAEFGYLGMINIVALYASIIFNKFNIIDTFIVFLFFILSFVYARLLMDERLIYMTIFIFIFISNSFVKNLLVKYLRYENPYNP